MRRAAANGAGGVDRVRHSGNGPCNYQRLERKKDLGKKIQLRVREASIKAGRG